MTAALGLPPPVLAAWTAAGVGAVVLVLLGFALANRVLLRMALRNIPRRRAQTALIVLGLLLASLIITAALTVGDTLTYSLQAIELRQIGGIDEAVTRQADQTPAGAGLTDADFFTDAQAAAVVDHARADPAVDSAAGVVVAPGALSDATSGLASSENLVVFGVPAGFDRLWGGLRSRSGAGLAAADLGPGEVYLGSSLADRIAARPGDRAQLVVQGRTVDVRVRDVLDTEVNPTVANQGPVTSSVVMPLAGLRSALGRPSGFNAVYVRNRGTGGLDDLGPDGATGQEVVRHLRSTFIDRQAATRLRAFLERPAIHRALQSEHDRASFLDPRRQLSQQLLAELAKPGVTDQFDALAGDGFVQVVMQAAVAASVPAAEQGTPAGQAPATELGQDLRALSVDSDAAAGVRDLLWLAPVRSGLARAAAAAPASSPAGQELAGLLAEPAGGPVGARFASLLATPDVRAQLRQVIAASAPAQLRRYDQLAGGLQLDVVSSYKADGVLFAQAAGLVASAALIGVSVFSLAVGVLLIFLIFVMLAAERRAEMGMSRAVGLKRRHLTQMFLFEGLAYTVVASAAGVLLGLGVGRLMIGVISGIFTGFYKGLDLVYHVEWPTVVIALCLGIALTFVVVVVSAYRVSRLNVVAAIRDLDETDARDRGPARLLADVFVNAWRSLRQLAHGHPLVFLGGLTAGTAGALLALLAALFRRGPLAVLLGLALAAAGLAAQAEALYGLGVSLLVVGAAMLLRWALAAARVRPPARSRIGFTAAAAGLLVYWGRPFGRVETLLHLDGPLRLGNLNGGPEVFVLTAFMVLLGAIWAVMYNSDLLIGAVMLVAGRSGVASATLRTSMAYPMSTKFRTGMAVAMFAIVTFMIAYMAIFKDVLTQNFANESVQSGGWQLVAGTPDQSYAPVDGIAPPADVAATVRADAAVSREVRAVGWENQSRVVAAREVAAGSPPSAPRAPGRGDESLLRVVDDGYLAGTGYAIQPRAAGYASDRAVWDAVRDHVGYAVVDSSLLTASGPGSPAVVRGIDPNDATFRPFQLDLTDAGGTGPAARATWRVTVVGFMTRPIWDGVYVSARTALADHVFAPPPPAGGAAPAPAAGQPPALTPTGYYFSVRPGVDPDRARVDLGRLLVRDELEAVSVADQEAQSTSALVTLLDLLTGFLALGLVVGIAGLGVISTRAVVERRQQIGMMRAIGYRRSAVQRSFLSESSFVAILGLLVGGLVGLWQSYEFFVVQRSLGSVVFHVPVVELGLILAGSYLATLLTTYLPARAASRVTPAEALRFE